MASDIFFRVVIPPTAADKHHLTRYTFLGECDDILEELRKTYTDPASKYCTIDQVVSRLRSYEELAKTCGFTIDQLLSQNLQMGPFRNKAGFVLLAFDKRGQGSPRLVAGRMVWLYPNRRICRESGQHTFRGISNTVPVCHSVEAAGHMYAESAGIAVHSQYTNQHLFRRLILLGDYIASAMGADEFLGNIWPETNQAGQLITGDPEQRTRCAYSIATKIFIPDKFQMCAFQVTHEDEEDGKTKRGAIKPELHFYLHASENKRPLPDIRKLLHLRP